MGALFSFLGGSVFRMLWGSISSFLDKRQDHAHEMELLSLQMQIDDAAHRRSIEQLQLQTTLGIKVIEAQTEQAFQKGESDAFTAAMQTAFKPTGITWVDAWNGVIRPAAATICLFLWCEALYLANFAMSDWDKELVGVILGFYFASRVLAKYGK